MTNVVVIFIDRIKDLNNLTEEDRFSINKTIVKIVLNTRYSHGIKRYRKVQKLIIRIILPFSETCNDY